MSQGEAAEQVVNAMTNVAIKGMECVSNLAGKGALNLATFLIAVIKEEKRTKGKARISSIIQDGNEMLEREISFSGHFIDKKFDVWDVMW